MEPAQSKLQCAASDEVQAALLDQLEFSFADADLADLKLVCHCLRRCERARERGCRLSDVPEILKQYK